MALRSLLSLMQTFECRPIFKLSPFILPPLPNVTKIHLILHAYALLRRERRKSFSFNSPKWIAIFPKPSRDVERHCHEKRHTLRFTDELFNKTYRFCRRLFAVVLFPSLHRSTASIYNRREHCEQLSGVLFAVRIDWCSDGCRMPYGVDGWIEQITYSPSTPV